MPSAFRAAWGAGATGPRPSSPGRPCPPLRAFRPWPSRDSRRSACGTARGEAMRTPWAGYDVLDKWDSPSFDNITRGVLSQRLHAIPERRFFDGVEFRLLEAISARL